MRVAAIGAAAAAVLEAALAATPISSVSTTVPGGGTCGAGCERLASVLMPETPKPAAPPPEPAAAPAVPKPSPESPANVIAPGASSQPSASRAIAGSGTSSGSNTSGGGGAPGGMPGGMPGDLALPGDPLASLGGLSGLNGLIAAPNAAATALSVVYGVVGVGTSLIGVGEVVVSTFTSLAITIALLENEGIIPKGSIG